MRGLTLKEKDIQKLEYRPRRCEISCLPPGIKCAYRGVYPGDIIKHEISHRKSILSNRRTKARYYEVPYNADSDEEQNNELNDHVKTINIEILPVDNDDVDRSPIHPNSTPHQDYYHHFMECLHSNTKRQQ